MINIRPNNATVNSEHEITTAINRFKRSLDIKNLLRGSKNIATTSASKNGAPTVKDKYNNPRATAIESIARTDKSSHPHHII